MAHVPNRAVGRNVHIFLERNAEPIGGDDWDMAGKVLTASAQEMGKSEARDGLLRCHLRMCVLANMRGLGERIL